MMSRPPAHVPASNIAIPSPHSCKACSRSFDDPGALNRLNEALSSEILSREEAPRSGAQVPGHQQNSYMASDADRHERERMMPMPMPILVPSILTLERYPSFGFTCTSPAPSSWHQVVCSEDSSFRASPALARAQSVNSAERVADLSVPTPVGARRLSSGHRGRPQVIQRPISSGPPSRELSSDRLARVTKWRALANGECFGPPDSPHYASYACTESSSIASRVASPLGYLEAVRLGEHFERANERERAAYGEVDGGIEYSPFDNFEMDDLPPPVGRFSQALRA